MLLSRVGNRRRLLSNARVRREPMHWVSRSDDMRHTALIDGEEIGDKNEGACAVIEDVRYHCTARTRIKISDFFPWWKWQKS